MDATKSLLMLPTSDELNEIYRDLGTSADKINDDAETIAEWMRKQPHLPDPEVDKRRIYTFLVLCKNSIESTKNALDQYYTVKSMVPEYFGHWDPTLPELEQSMNTALQIPLPKLTKEKYRVCVLHFRTPEVDKFVISDYMKVNFMTTEIRISKLDMYKKNVLIFDLNQLTMYHHAKILPELKKIIYSSTKAFPLRIHQLHLINMPSYAQSLVIFSRGALKKKIANKIMIHNNVEDLKNYIDPEILPLDYGGNFPKTLEEISEDWKEELMKHRDWYLSQYLIVSDESKRIKKNNVKTDYMSVGVEGSFRKLEID